MFAMVIMYSFNCPLITPFGKALITLFSPLLLLLLCCPRAALLHHEARRGQAQPHLGLRSQQDQRPGPQTGHQPGHLLRGDAPALPDRDLLPEPKQRPRVEGHIVPGTAGTDSGHIPGSGLPGQLQTAESNSVSRRLTCQAQIGDLLSGMPTSCSLTRSTRLPPPGTSLMFSSDHSQRVRAGARRMIGLQLRQMTVDLTYD